MSIAAWPAPPAPRSRPYGMVEFRAMASPCRIVADDQSLAEEGERLVHHLEALWSRFRADSEVSHVNRAGGSVCVVSPETSLLFERAESARRLTRGVFNPLVLDRSELVERIGTGIDVSDPLRHPAPLVDAGIVTIPSACAVSLPGGLRFDPGGIGKGLAGDLVVERLLALGATTVQVELGGDVRLAGENWVGGPWMVTVVDPRDRSAQLGAIAVAEGAVATSSSLGRRWGTGDDALHHLIDPTTGWPSSSDLVSVTTTSSELWWAEVVAKTVLISGSRRAHQVMSDLGAAGLTLDRNGTVTPVSVQLEEV